MSASSGREPEHRYNSWKVSRTSWSMPPCWRLATTATIVEPGEREEVMNKIEATASAPADTRQKVQELVNRAAQGDTKVLPALRQILNAHPEMWEEYGDLAAHAQEAGMQLIAGKNLLMLESLRCKTQELKTAVMGDNPSTLERLLAERVAVTWLQVNYADALYAQTNKPHAKRSLLREQQNRQESAQRSHLAAIKQLALIRKLLKPGLSPLDLLSRPSAESAAKKPAFKVRRAESVTAGVPMEN